MSKAGAEKHLTAAASYIAVAESGDAKRLAYEKAADEILAAQAEDPVLTQRQIGDRIGKSQKWVYELLRWRNVDAAQRQPLPFSRTEHQYRYAERQVPTRHEDRVEMATKLLSDPVVMKTAVKQATQEPEARAAFSRMVYDHNADRRRVERERAQQRAADGAVPLPTYMAKMVEKMNDWALGLAGLVDDLDELPEGRGRELVAKAATNLRDQAQRWVDRLEPERPALTVIEGRAEKVS